MVEHVDDLMRGYKISVSFSCPSHLLIAIEEYRDLKHFNQSQTIVRLIRLGITYTKMLAEQALEKERLKVASVKQKKAKPKHPKQKKKK